MRGVRSEREAGQPSLVHPQQSIDYHNVRLSCNAKPGWEPSGASLCAAPASCFYPRRYNSQWRSRRNCGWLALPAHRARTGSVGGASAGRAWCCRASAWRDFSRSVVPLSASPPGCGGSASGMPTDCGLRGATRPGFALKQQGLPSNVCLFLDTSGPRLGR